MTFSTTVSCFVAMNVGWSTDFHFFYYQNLWKKTENTLFALLVLLFISKIVLKLFVYLNICKRVLILSNLSTVIINVFGPASMYDPPLTLQFKPNLNIGVSNLKFIAFRHFKLGRIWAFPYFMERWRRIHALHPTRWSKTHLEIVFAF